MGLEFDANNLPAIVEQLIPDLSITYTQCYWFRTDVRNIPGSALRASSVFYSEDDTTAQIGSLKILK